MSLLSAKESKALVDCIHQAEQKTSGEIRIHIEKKCPIANPQEHCIQLFYKLGMDKTIDRNGVLIYVATKDRIFHVLGDKNIHDRVGQSYWEDVVQQALPLLRSGNYYQALCHAVEQTGEKLGQLFPPREGDTDELTNQISEG